MPIYEYRCEAGHTTEKVRIVDRRHAPTTCACGRAAKLIISRTGRPKFHGQGFYETEYVNPKAPWRSLGDTPPEDVQSYKEVERDGA